MRPKLSYVGSQENGENVSAMNDIKAEDDNRLNETLLQLEDDSICTAVLPDDWLEEEAAKREEPQVKKLTRIAETILQENQEYLLSYSTDLPLRLAEEVVRLSRDEPGGVNACRVGVNVVAKESCCADVEIKDFFKSDKQIPLTRLGSATIAENRVVATSEIDIYLFSSSSVLCRLHKIMASLRGRSREGSSRLQRANLLPEFVLVKRKLFRSRNSNPSIVVKSISK